MYMTFIEARTATIHIIDMDMLEADNIVISPSEEYVIILELSKRVYRRLIHKCSLISSFKSNRVYNVLHSI